jgi:hypothetical protein
MDLTSSDGDHATLASRPGNRTTHPVLALGPNPSAGAGHSYHPDELERIDPIRSGVLAIFWMLCGFAAAVGAYGLYHLGRWLLSCFT